VAKAERVQRPTVEDPLTPVYPFGAAGEPITLHEGMLGGVTPEEQAGSVFLSLQPKPSLRWKINSHGGHAWTETGDIRLSLQRPCGTAVAEGVGTSYGEGSINGVEVLKPGARIQRALFHWVNLPPIAGNVQLAAPDGEPVELSSEPAKARLRLTVGTWDLTLDCRPDHSKIFEDAKTKHLYAVTHVMEVRRANGSDFEENDIGPLSEALRVGLSFAFGRWVSSAINVGFDHSGTVVWESWGPPICEPYKPIGSPVICWGSLSDVISFLERVVDRFENSDKYDTTRFQMILAAQTAELGFVENRIFSAFPALENLEWVTLKLDEGRSNQQYDDLGDSAERLQIMLESASVPLGIDPSHLPALYDFAEKNGLNGPQAVVWVRNRLVHPKRPHDHIYGRSRLVVDAWLLSREYVCLLVLHSIKYRGSYQPAVPPSGMLFDVRPVPWVQ
jgi:hypothetical protein